MTTFDRREESFENQFAHDAEMKFRAESRRNKLVGLWAAERLGLTGAAADSYARDVIDTAVAPAGGRAVIHKITADLAAKGISVSEAAIHDKMTELLKVAATQIGARE
jgi:hypothetical protein